jgi:hypothetical protein
MFITTSKGTTEDYPLTMVNGNLQAIRLLLDGNSYPADKSLPTTITDHASMWIHTLQALGAYKDYGNDVTLKYVDDFLNDNKQWLYGFDLADTEIDSAPNDGKVQRLTVELDFSSAPGGTDYNLNVFVERERTFGVIADTRRVFVYDT